MKASRAGFTLIEVMVVALLLGVLVAGVMQSLTAQKKSASLNSQIVDIQQGSRLVGDVLEDDIRHAGMLVPESAALCAIDETNAPDTLVLSDAGAIDPEEETRNDLGARVQGGATNVTSGSQTLNVDALVLEFESPDPAYDTDGDGTADSDFRANGGVIIADAGNPSRGAACGLVTDVSLAGPTLTVSILSNPLGGLPGTPEPVDLVAVPAHIYSIDANLRLLRDGTVVSRDVEDLQVAIFVDQDEDRVVDVGEYLGNGVNPAFDPAAVDISRIVEVRTNFVIRTWMDDQENPNGRFQSAENRNDPGGSDGFRRRSYSSTVHPRNLGSRVSTT